MYCYEEILLKFKAACLNLYGLDPCQHSSSPGLSWDAMSKITDVKLEKYQTLTSTYLLKKD